MKYAHIIVTVTFLALVAIGYGYIAYKTCVVEQATTFWCQ